MFSATDCPSAGAAFQVLKYLVGRVLAGILQSSHGGNWRAPGEGIVLCLTVLMGE